MAEGGEQVIENVHDIHTGPIRPFMIGKCKLHLLNRAHALANFKVNY